MIIIGAFEARTHLSALLDKVEAGEEVVITRQGRQDRLGKMLSSLKEIRKQTTLDGLSWKELRDQGRK